MKVVPDFLERRGYRLPTEAEWEYACRAGAVTPWFFGSAVERLDQYAAFGRSEPGEPELVGLTKPNDYGLFDMLGNVSEWCHDVYGREASDGAAIASDALNIGKDSARVLRGGSIVDLPAQVRSSARDKALPGERTPTIGFRVVRSNF